MLGRAISCVVLLFTLAGCGYPRLESTTGGRDDPNSREFSVVYVPLYGTTERDAYVKASQRCYPKLATKIWHEYLSISPMEGNRAAYRCD